MCEQGVSFVVEQELGISPLLQALLKHIPEGGVSIYIGLNCLIPK